MTRAIFAALCLSACASVAPRASTAPLVLPPSPRASVAVAEKPAPAPPATCHYDVRDASSRWNFAIDVDAPCAKPGDVACGGPARIGVRDKNAAEVQRIELASVCVDPEGTIIAGDFDFDGREDFGVEVGEDGPYGGPTFDVYLHAPDSDRFVRSEPLSALTRNRLGFFEVDRAHRRLVTSEKSGCCYHVTETLAVENGVPKPVERLTVDNMTDPDVVVETHEVLLGRTWRRTVTRHAP